MVRPIVVNMLIIIVYHNIIKGRIGEAHDQHKKEGGAGVLTFSIELTLSMFVSPPASSSSFTTSAFFLFAASISGVIPSCTKYGQARSQIN